MISAKEARNMSVGNKSEETKTQLLEAEKSIKKGISDGDVKCYCYRMLGDQAVKELEKLGYRVRNRSDQREGTMFEISW